MIQYRNDEIRIERGIKTWLKIDSPKREKSARTNVIHGSLMKTRSTRVDSPSRIIKRRVLLKNTLSFFPRSTIQSNRSNSPSNGRRKSSNRQKSRTSVVAENCRPPRWIKKREREGEGEKKRFSRAWKKRELIWKAGEPERERAGNNRHPQDPGVFSERGFNSNSSGFERCSTGLLRISTRAIQLDLNFETTIVYFNAAEFSVHVTNRLSSFFFSLSFSLFFFFSLKNEGANSLTFDPTNGKEICGGE